MKSLDFFVHTLFCFLIFLNLQSFSTYTLLPSLTTGTQLNPRYVLVNQYMTWPNAQRFCRENFTDLATVRNDAENQAVTSVAQKAAWIGLFRGPNFYWSDESSFLFTNWVITTDNCLTEHPFKNDQTIYLGTFWGPCLHGCITPPSWDRKDTKTSRHFSYSGLF
uniref:C-type lectin domain-containing protein n=1 Tax=Kryptolebias marmoratus TaxID=37003 RepID=A0A3Q3B2F9_KRYMA